MSTTKVEMSLLAGIVEKIISTVKTLFNVTGDAPIFACRAWVNFDGTTTPPTIRASGNVSSVVRNATGDYTVNFTSPLQDGNFVPTYAGSPFRVFQNGIQGSAAYRFLSSDAAAVATNYVYISLAFFR